LGKTGQIFDTCVDESSEVQSQDEWSNLSLEGEISGVPSAKNSDHFIPPQPMSLGSEEIKEGALSSVEGSDIAANIDEKIHDPGNSADDVRPSLFELVTRTGKAAMNFQGKKKEEKTPYNTSTEVDETKESAFVKLNAESKVDKDISFSEIDTLNSPDATGVQSESLSISEEGKKVEGHDDLLDIPAFLRRQAN
jgi:hypothetical protein